MTAEVDVPATLRRIALTLRVARTLAELGLGSLGRFVSADLAQQARTLLSPESLQAQGVFLEELAVELERGRLP